MLKELTQKLIAGRNLTEEEAAQSLELILSDQTSDAAIASFLTALAVKGETAEEITGFARVMRKHAVPVVAKHAKVVDTAGTGGGVETFNISTTAAFVIAGAGLAVAKHGNRAVTSKCGSADVLSALGVKIDCTPQVVERCLNDVGIAFLFAPLFHPAMKRVAQIRRELAHRTIFNILGPLTNPAGANYQIIGVYAPELTEKLAGALSRLGSKRAWVVHSYEGLDELCGRTKVSEVTNSTVRTFDLEVSRNLSRFSRANAEITKEILEGKLKDNIVITNAAAAIHITNDISFDDAIAQATESINSGAALKKLNQLIEATNKC